MSADPRDGLKPTLLPMMALVQLFILPDYFRRPFTISWWSFSFPLASGANTVGQWAIASPDTVGRVLAWSTLIVATAMIGLLAALTARTVWLFRSHRKG